jgi:hypothetical protein
VALPGSRCKHPHHEAGTTQAHVVIKSDAPTEDNTCAEVDSPAEDIAPIEDNSPTEDDAPAEDNLPADDKAPTEEVPAEDIRSAEGVAPAEHDLPASGDIPDLRSSNMPYMQSHRKLLFISSTIVALMAIVVQLTLEMEVIRSSSGLTRPGWARHRDESWEYHRGGY